MVKVIKNILYIIVGVFTAVFAFMWSRENDDEKQVKKNKKIIDKINGDTKSFSKWRRL